MCQSESPKTLVDHKAQPSAYSSMDNLIPTISMHVENVSTRRRLGFYPVTSQACEKEMRKNKTQFIEIIKKSLFNFLKDVAEKMIYLAERRCAASEGFGSGSTNVPVIMNAKDLITALEHTGLFDSALPSLKRMLELPGL